MQEKTQGLPRSMIASYTDHAEVVKLLLDKGADVAAQKKDGKTALMLAASKDHKDIVALLKERGAAK